MANITIEIPKEVLQRGGSRKFLVVDPDFIKELKKNWEMGDALKASRLGRQEHRLGKTKILKSLSQIMK